MRIIVAGSREITDAVAVERAIEFSGIYITELVHGAARGVDRIARDWAIRNGIPHKPFPVTQADWNRLGKQAGPLRNEDMARYVGPYGALIALWDGESSGTESMIHLARDYELNLYTYIYHHDDHSVDPVIVDPNGHYRYF